VARVLNSVHAKCRAAFVIQAAMLAPFGIAAMFVDASDIDACPEEAVRLCVCARAVACL